jgi:hypothetical protein
VTFGILYVFFVLSLESRRVLYINVTRQPTPQGRRSRSSRQSARKSCRRVWFVIRIRQMTLLSTIVERNGERGDERKVPYHVRRH